eukprot:1907848-Amphidinium_carterae.1
MDRWAGFRTKKYPATLSCLGVAITVYKKLLAYGLIVFAPCTALAAQIDNFAKSLASCDDLLKYHPGARYMYGIRPAEMADVDSIRTLIGNVGPFFIESGELSGIYQQAQYGTLANSYLN